MNTQQLFHVAIIPDGNRRWAKKRLLFPWKGHEQAIENFRTLTDWCRHDPRVGTLTVWCFSTENWKRDPEEVKHLMDLFESFLQKERDTFQKNRTRFLHSGRKDRIPPSLASLIEDVSNETKHFTEFTLHLAVDYGGKDEVLRTMNRIPKNQQITDELLRSHLDQPSIPDIDLIIRTSGEQRTSNFFLWQSTYAEWMFLDVLFPDFGTDQLAGAIAEFERRTRRFGA
jgi:undecaprenyl diphosphate synthase